MQIASILSDLDSLRVCDHTAALALVTAKPSSSSSSSSSTTASTSTSEKVKEDEKEDVDLRRATDLLELHYGVKMKYVRARREGGGGGAAAGEEDKELRQARKDVEGVLERLKKIGGEAGED